MKASYKDTSLNADFEQHANKIFTGIKEINPQYDEKRAIWELFQNALDVTEERGIIKVIQTPEGFRFDHNGMPLDVGNLTGLIKQSSIGKTYGSNKTKVGQYGTGLLSTHVYGKRIRINASVQTNDNKIKLLSNFLLDRDAESLDKLLPKIRYQDSQAAILCDGDDCEIPKHLAFTSFEYLADERTSLSIERMFNYMPDILPFIFAFNDKLDVVESVFNSVKNKYVRIKTTDNSVDLMINGIPTTINYLSDSQNNLRIIFPSDKSKFESVPKLFLFYPLMGTTYIGTNFLIHAQEFKPNRERGYLHLKAVSAEVKNDVDENERLLSCAFEMIIKKIKEDATLDFIAISNISFASSDDQYLIDRKLELIKEIKDLERISIGEKTVALSYISYLSQAILDLGEEVLRGIYPIIAEFYWVPEYDQYIYLSNKVNNWRLYFTDDYVKSKGDTLDILEFKDILEEIASSSEGKYDSIENQDSYKCLLKAVAKDSELLNLEVVPNIHGQLKSQQHLKRWKEIENLLISVMDGINKDVSSTYLHPDFYFLDNTPVYSRENFKDDINKLNATCIAQLEKYEGEISKVNSEQFRSVIKGLSFFISLNKTTETNKRLSYFIHSVFDIVECEEEIANPTVQLDYDSSFKLLSRLYIRTLIDQPTEFIKGLVNRLKELVDILDKNYELKRNLLDKLPCYPNQIFQLKGQSALKIDECKDEDFKTKYREITNKEIREELVLPDFEVYLPHKNSIAGIQLGDEIERTISPTGNFVPEKNVVDEKSLQILLSIIEHLSKPDSKWPQWLPNLNKVKEEVLMHKFQDDATRASLFSILSGTEANIKLLGELSKVDDLTDLIRAGKAKQKEEARAKKHLEHINEVGLKIQDIIKEELDSSLADTMKLVNSASDSKLTNDEEQNGQDFIIYRGNTPIFYIEVKSRWDSDGVVALSKRQIERCAVKKDKYAVITVNVADYKTRNKIEDDDVIFKDLINDIYVNRDLGDEFEKLIKENLQYEAIAENAKLIEYRGHIPQTRIKKDGPNFEGFINELKLLLLKEKL